MARKIMGLDLAQAVSTLKAAGYTITAFFEDDRWFQAENDSEKIGFYYDRTNCVYDYA